MFGFDLVRLLTLQSRTMTALAQNGHCLDGTKAGFSKITNPIWFCRADSDTFQVEVWGLLLVQNSSSGLFLFFPFVAAGAVFVQAVPWCPLAEASCPRTRAAVRIL